ncbi:putative cytoplasmic protein [Bifidobacterium choerinum]|uniref:Putative cytoplasmic protein n=1 Tax=Bifidobacterium choerinum TaxID=35760 RepID=A0A087AEK6_9BIFI|nr:putative cytoplasmic protein [Bifidobacterium choerinum]
MPYDAWSGQGQDLVLRLSERYGDALRGIAVDAAMGYMKMFIYVDADGAR